MTSICLAVAAVPEGRMMRRKPRTRWQRISDRKFLRTMGLSGVLTAVAVYYWRMQAKPHTAGFRRQARDIRSWVQCRCWHWGS